MTEGWGRGYWPPLPFLSLIIHIWYNPLILCINHRREGGGIIYDINPPILHIYNVTGGVGSYMMMSENELRWIIRNYIRQGKQYENDDKGGGGYSNSPLIIYIIYKGEGGVIYDDERKPDQVNNMWIYPTRKTIREWWPHIIAGPLSSNQKKKSWGLTDHIHMTYPPLYYVYNIGGDGGVYMR